MWITPTEVLISTSVWYLNISFHSLISSLVNFVICLPSIKILGSPFTLLLIKIVYSKI